MKNIFTLSAMLCLSLFSGAQIVETTNSTDYSSCNGSATIGINYTQAEYLKTWYHDSTEIATGVDSVFNLCPGTYSVMIDSLGYYITGEQFYIYSDAIVNIGATLATTADYGTGGTATIVITSGVAPFQYQIGGQSFSGSQTNATATGLAPGIYDTWVTHAAYDTVFFNFAIYSDSAAYGTISDTNYVDTLNGSQIENCAITYSLIDAGWLAGATGNNQNLVIDWAIVSGGDTMIVTDTLVFSDTASGNYLVTVVIYCPTKSGSDFMAIKGEIPMSNGHLVLALEEEQLLNVAVYPNPFNETLNIVLDNEGASAELFDLQGKLVSSFGLLGKVSTLDVTALKAGFYLLKLTSSSGTATVRIQK